LCDEHGWQELKGKATPAQIRNHALGWPLDRKIVSPQEPMF
jgi:hypothetical protein